MGGRMKKESPHFSDYRCIYSNMHLRYYYFIRWWVNFHRNINNCILKDPFTNLFHLHFVG